VRQVSSSPAFEIVPATPELFEAGLQLHARRPDQTWSLTDCLSFEIMTCRGITRALTHDHHFEQAGFEALLRHDPPPLKRLEVGVLAKPVHPADRSVPEMVHLPPSAFRAALGMVNG
jgi:hypothetical protein